MQQPRPDKRSRLVIAQFGNFGVAEKRLMQGGFEDYYAQRYTVEYIMGLAKSGVDIVSIFLGQDLPLERLPSGVANVGIELYPRGARPRVRQLLDLISGWQPTHLLLGVPLPPAIWWAVRRGVRILPLLADSFAAADLKSKIRHFLLAVALNHPDVPWVANHGMNAARDLVRIGVPSKKVLAFDWPAVIRAEDFAPKKAPNGVDGIRVIFVGRLDELKGLGDCISAMAFLGANYRLTVVGKGDQPFFERLSRDLAVSDRVHFTGPLAHSKMLQLMHEHDVVVVPSRHGYPEGLPMTIYEGLCSRTPVVVSDHPMFRAKIIDQKNGMMFKAREPKDLAGAITTLVNDPVLYERLSLDAETVCRGFFSSPKWHEIIGHWLTGSPDDDAWLSSRTLASLA